MTSRRHRQATAELARVVRDHAGRLAAVLVRLLGDFAAAEDLVAGRRLAALEHWPVEGIPDRPGRLAAHRRPPPRPRPLRRAEQLPGKAGPAAPGRAPAAQDDRLQLIFTCCHPALPRDAQIALTLRAVCGLTTAQIARGFLISRRPRSAQRHHPRQAEDHRRRHPVPGPGRRRARRPAGRRAGRHLPAVQRGLPVHRGAAARRDLADDAEWLAGLLAPADAGRARGRRPAGADPAAPGPAGRPLRRRRTAWSCCADQDRSLWDRAAITEATGLLTRAARQHRPGPVPAAGRDRRLPCRGRRWEDDRLAADHAALRHARCTSRRRR